MWIYATYKGEERTVTEEYVSMFLRNTAPESDTKELGAVIKDLRKTKESIYTLQGKIYWEDTRLIR